MNSEPAPLEAAAAPAQDRLMRTFFILWGGQSISLLGSQAVQFALIWWLTAETGSATVLATAAILGLLPQSLLGPFIGALVDRWNRKRIMLVADSAIAAASALLAWSFFFEAATVTHVMTLLLARAVGSAFHGPAMAASTTLMVPKKHLTRIQGLNQSVQGGQMIITAPLGALMVAALPMAGVMAVDVLTALVAIVPLLFIQVPQPQRDDYGSQTRLVSTLRDTRAGLHYIWSSRGHTSLLVMAAGVNLLMVPALSLMPLMIVEQGGGAPELAWMYSLFGVGMIAGGIGLGIWGGFQRRIYTSFAALLGAGLGTLLVGGTSTWTIALVGFVVLGVMVPLINGPIHAVLQMTVPPDMQGRVFASYTSLATLMTPVGLVLAAPIADLLGIRALYLAGGTACLVMGVGGFVTPAIAKIEDQASAIS